MKNKMLTIILILLVAISLVSIIGIVVYTNFTGDKTEGEKEPTIDEIIKTSVDVPEVTTNLASGDFIKITLTIQTDSKKAQSELEKRVFQVNNILITELSEKKSEDLSSKKGKEDFQESLKTIINKVMQEGKVEKVYITSSILQ